MSTRADEMAWFMENAPTWEWTWARTFSKTAPHSYVIKDKHLNPEDYERAFMLTQMCGRPRKFWKRVNIELECPDLTMEYGPMRDRQTLTGFKFWPMSHQRSVSKAFNVAPLGMFYGKQDAPDTTTSADHPFDFNAGDWHDLRDATVGDTYDGMRAAVWKEVMDDRRMGSLLDLGPRIGFAQDLMIARERAPYRAVEPSQGMLNQLLFRHQWVRDVWPMTVGEYLVQPKGHDYFDTAIALLGTASYLPPEVIREVSMVADNLHLMFYRDTEDDFFGPTYLPDTWQEALAVARSLPGATMRPMGRFELVQVRS